MIAPPVLSTPTVAAVAAAQAAHDNQQLAIGSLFTRSNADGDAPTQSQIGLVSSAGQAPFGTLTQGGATLDATSKLTLTALSCLTYTGGGTAGTDDLQLRAAEGSQWSSWALVQISDIGAVPPVATATAAPESATPGETLTVANLFSVSDPDGNAITQYQVYLSS
jgi:hypothetical protein